MDHPLRHAVLALSALAGLWAATGAQAQPAASATPAAVAGTAATSGAAATAAPAASAARRAEPGSERRVIEDEQVRIEETRIRGQVQRITVRSKLTGQDYEIIVGPGGRDPSQRGDAAGQRAWSVFRF